MPSTQAISASTPMGATSMMMMVSFIITSAALLKILATGAALGHQGGDADHDGEK